MSLTVGSLFAGIGGFDLGFERAGFEIKWQVEIDPFCRRVLEKHWSQVKRYEDVRTTHVADAQCNGRNGSRIEAYSSAALRETGQIEGEESTIERVTDAALDCGSDCGRGCANCLAAVDVLTGGFPCQPHSLAGRRGGASDERDLWPEFARLIRELKPRWVVAENVPGLLSNDAGRFFGGILRDLAACGFDAEWDCLPAAAFGAPHRRDRVWMVAYANERRCEVQRIAQHADERGTLRRESDGCRSWRSGNGSAVGQSEFARLERHARNGAQGHESGRIFARANGSAGAASLRRHAEQWRIEPDVGRVAHGVPARVDRLRGLGNAIVPQIAQWIAERIKEAEGLT